MFLDVRYFSTLLDHALMSGTDHEFTQLIKGYQGERLRQAFRYFDQDGDGYINPDEFQRIIVVSF